MMKVFVDTGAWAALAIEQDEHHSEALELLDSLNGKVVQLITSDYVLDETLTLIRFRKNHEKAVDVGKSLLKSSIVRIITVEQSLWDSAWKKFVRFKDKKWSFTDCTSFVIMDSLHIEDAFAFDRNFKQYGKRIIPSK